MGNRCDAMPRAAAVWACLLVGVVVLAAPAGAADNAGNAAHGERLAAHYRLESPAGAGPFPAVLLVSGCSGFSAPFAGPHYDTAQARLVELGFLTVRVNYLAAREAPSCIQVHTAMVADDIAWVVADLRRHPRVKADAINLLGWSWGGAGVLRALGAKDGRAPVAAAVAYSPVCTYAVPWQGTVPVLVLHGAIDDVAPLAACEALFARVPDAGRPRLVVLPDAHHGFDNAQLPADFKYPYGTLASNPAAATKAWAELAAFLRR